MDALPYVDVLLPNEREACLLAEETDSSKAIDILRQRVPLLVIKRGEAGAEAYTSGCRISSPALPLQVVDAVGAGDSFNAGFLHGFVRGWPIERTLSFGNLTGGWSTSARGGTTAFRGAENLQAFQQAWLKIQAEASS